MTRARELLIAAVLANVLGWLSPVIDEFRGWQAFRVALSPVWPFEAFRIEEGYLAILSVASALTNGLFAAIAVLLWVRSERGLAKVCLWLAAGTTLLNLHWPITMGDSAADLELGYYVWVVGFALLALAAYRGLAELSPRRAR
jgi:hypothetical protein